VIGRTLSHFRITEQLGQGGMGAVYLAEDLKLKRQVALKLLPERLTDNPDRLARLQREAETLAALNHPSIVAIYSVEETESQRFLIMERVVGQTLQDLIPEEGFDIEKFFSIAIPIADAMAAAHANGIVHRDLKPANVMVTDTGVAKVLDLGLAKLQEQPEAIDEDAPTQTVGPTVPGVIVGTVGYMSPEQAEGKPVGPPSDVFSLGILFYEMFSGRNPFRRKSAASSLAAILHHQPERLRKLRREVPRDLQTILDRCLTKAPEDRYPSARELHVDLVASHKRFRRLSTGWRAAIRRPGIAASLLVALVLVAAGAIWYRGVAAERRWAREEALPEIERLIEENWRDFSEPYALAVQAETHIPNDERLRELLTRCSLPVTVTTEPPGAQVSVKNYGSPDDEWETLGTTPLDGVRLPIGVLRWHFGKPGYETTEAVASTWALSSSGALLEPNHVHRVLDVTADLPPGMVRVIGNPTEAGPLPYFYIDRYEVTNRQFKEFVDGGGYRTPHFWRHEFVDGETALTHDEAMARFVDRTDRPGPATWEAGSYPEGREDHPVTGISWYEAAAYAEFVGKALPTTYHWGLARGEGEWVIQLPQLGGYALFAPFSNFANEGSIEVGSLPGITSFGAYDLAGNAREWCSNETQHGAVVRGGGWNDVTYMFAEVSQLPLLNRSPENGFRCALYPEPEAIPDAAFAQINIGSARDLDHSEPVPDEIFAVYRERFAYDRTDLQARIESTHDDNDYWTREVISYDTAYGGERMLAHLFLPRSARPPYHTVVYFPGSGSLMQASSTGIDEYFEIPVFVSHLIKNGRAVLYPVYKGTFERQDLSLLEIHEGSDSHRYTEYLVQLMKDLSRSIDYLETRDDIDSGKLAFYGLSWGAALGGVALAVEDRFQTAVLLSGGIPTSLPGRNVLFRPEADPVNYLPRVELPVLMLNGRYDTLFPLDRSIQPMYDFLGTPGQHKRLLLYDTDHIPPRKEFIKETLAWLDSYLGHVE
jgi:dienelactone hydrolase